MPLFGTFKDASVDAVPELAPGGYDPSDLESGLVLQAASNFGTEGGQVRYRWIHGIRWKPYVPNPHKQMYTPVHPFPARVNKTSVVQIPNLGIKTPPTSFTPPSTASLYSFDEGDIY
jgi:hypothetical protein